MSDIISITYDELPKISPRQCDSHKGNFGKVLVLGGSRRMIGAPALTANGALRGGVGLVTIAAPANIQLSIASLCPCATSLPLAITTNNALAPEAVNQLKKAIAQADIIVAGPGMGVGIQQQMLIQAIIEQEKPAIIDADGLNNIVNISNWPELVKCPLVLTPHPGEFSRLIDQPIPADTDARKAAAIEAVKEFNKNSELPFIMVLKGAGTVVADANQIYVNTTGNPGMATGGSGDVLAGLIAGMAMQGLNLFNAASLGTYVHGLAGDLAAKELTEESLIACDLLEYIPHAMKSVTEK